MRNPIIEEDLRFITSARLPWEKFAGKNILISGANGFLPAYTVETLLYLNETRLKKKAKVFALVRDAKKAKNRFAHYRARRDLRFIVQDVCSPVKVRDRFHFIVHAASQASPKKFGTDPAGTISANTVGTYHLLELARAKKTEGFLFISSGEVYGRVNENEMPIAEDTNGFVDPASIRSCYAEGKRAGETMCVSWWHQYGVPAKIVRPFHTYGPGMSLDDGRVYSDFVSDVVHGRDIVMKSDGNAMRTFCYLADAATAFFTVLLKGENAQAYNVADKDGEISINGLASMMIGLFPEKELSVKKCKTTRMNGYLKNPLERSHPSTSRLEKLGWKPRHSLRKGFERTVRSYYAKRA